MISFKNKNLKEYVASAINGSLKKRVKNTNEFIKVNGHKRLINHIRTTKT